MTMAVKDDNDNFGGIDDESDVGCGSGSPKVV